MLTTLMSAMEARLSAVEAAICLVPLSLQDPHNQPAKAPNDRQDDVQMSVSKGKPHTSTSACPVDVTSSNVQSPHPQTSTNIPGNTQSTPKTPSLHPRPLTSISPIVSGLPTEKAINLKKSKRASRSRKQYARKCLLELFSLEELSNSNTSGSGDKDCLDQYKLGLLNRKC